MNNAQLPHLPLTEWQETLDTLHMWTQIVGKIANARTPLVNHFWNSTLRVTPGGLTTMPLSGGHDTFSIEFDLVSHELRIKCESGETRTVELRPRTVADFYEAVLRSLSELRIEAKIWTMPVELEKPIRFTEDTMHASYDTEYVERFRKILVWNHEVFTEFRSRFLGKSSPVQFFWGSFDLAVTRFNGERAPAREGADFITREAYSHSCISHGFWCGGGPVQEPSYYAYAAPEPTGFRDRETAPPESHYHPVLNEFLLSYETVRQADSPRDALLQFMQTTYDAGADLGNWNREELEREAS